MVTEHKRVMDFIAEKVPPAKWNLAGKGSDVVPPGAVELSALYINLDSNADRREHIEKELDTLAVPAQRVPAIKELYGPLGALKSHIKALGIAKENASPWTVIFEDDFAFDGPVEETKTRIQFVLENNRLAPVWLGDWVVNGPAPQKHPVHLGAREANGACNNASCYFIRYDYIDVLLGTWEAALANLVADLRQAIELKRGNNIEEIGHLWWYSPDSAWAPLQIRDHWLLFDPELGRQQIGKFGSDVQSSIKSFETLGFREVAVDELKTDIG